MLILAMHKKAPYALIAGTTSQQIIIARPGTTGLAACNAPLIGGFVAHSGRSRTIVRRSRREKICGSLQQFTKFIGLLRTRTLLPTANLRPHRCTWGSFR